MKNWRPFWFCLGLALILNAVAGFCFWLFYNPDHEIHNPYEKWSFIAFCAAIVIGVGLIKFGLILALKNNILVLTATRLIEATAVSLLITILFPLFLIVAGIYLKVNRGIKFSETWSEGPNLYAFLILNVFPIFFVILPELAYVQKLAKRERRMKDQKTLRSSLDFEKLRVGDVVLTGSDKWMEAIPIKASNILTAGEDYRYWTHAAIYAGDGNIVEAQVDGRGVTQTPLKNFLERGQEIMVLRHRYVFPEEAAKAVEFCRDLVKKDTAYDWWGVTFYSMASLEPKILDGFLASDYACRVFNVGDSYFCSELVAEAYSHTGHELFDRRAWRVKPLDFMFNPLFKQVDCDFVIEPV